MKQILIVEDDSFLNKMLAYNLTADGISAGRNEAAVRDPFLSHADYLWRYYDRG